VRGVGRTWLGDGRWWPGAALSRVEVAQGIRVIGGGNTTMGGGGLARGGPAMA
jgi:hypothetical protein